MIAKGAEKLITVADWDQMVLDVEATVMVDFTCISSTVYQNTMTSCATAMALVQTTASSVNVAEFKSRGVIEQACLNKFQAWIKVSH
jgi:hypothetical protein